LGRVLIVDEDWVRLICRRPTQIHCHDRPGSAFWDPIIEDKIPEAVKDQAMAVLLDRLQHVGVMPGYDVGACIDDAVRKRYLVW
jgi:hypothetical protein